MHPVIRTLLMLLLPGLVCAQDAGTPPPVARPTAPARSIAVLVDVSGSLKKKFTFTQEAREIILDLVAGRGFQGLNGWVCENDETPAATADGWTLDPVLKELYAPYLYGKTGQSPLTKAGKVGRYVPFGSLDTTLRGRDPWDITDVESFESRLRMEYPKRPEEFNDRQTCYFLAVARTADFLLQRFEEGCYMFVVSDELDDPDTVDVMPALEAAGIYDPGYMRKMRGRFEELKKQQRFHFIARFRKGDRKEASTGGSGYVRLSWYAIGEKPQAVQPPEPPPVIAVKEGDPPVPPPQPPEPPKFIRTLTLLGGLVEKDANVSTRPGNEADIKLFDHDQPFLAWQVDGTPTGAVDSPFQITVHRLSEGGSLEQVQQLKPAQLSRTSEGRLRGLMAGTTTQPLANGIYRITVEEKPVGGGEGLKAVSAWIEVRKPWNWVPWMLGASALSAVGVIGYSVWTLRR
jgi:hypothetical protein